MKKLAIPLLGFAALLVCSTLRAQTPILPFDEVERGMRGSGRTVFQGMEIESFDVEIVGKLPNIGPGQNLILARCSGGPLAQTRILAGMSGSPVTIDGKLIGAVAYSWGFVTEAIAGITPIEEMLAVTTLDSEPRTAAGGAFTLASDWYSPMHDATRLVAFFERRLGALVPPTGAALRPAVPLSVSGIGSAGLNRIAPDLQRAGFSAVQVGGAGSAARPSPPLEPGSAVGLKLVRGDIEMTATGTVTWVDGDQVLAFGHPLFGLGGVDLPLTGADVQTVLPSLQQSSRIAVPLAEVGALRQDRAAAVYGRIGASPRMIPVRIQFERPDGRSQTYSFDIADDPLLSPLLLYNALNGILAGNERAFGEATVRLNDGSVIKMAQGEDVAVDNVYAGPTAFTYGTGLAAYVLHLLMNNVWAPPQIAGVNLILEYEQTPRIARIRRASVNRYRVRPGEVVEATVQLSSYRGPDQLLTAQLEIPAETPPGRLSLHFGGALAVSRAEDDAEPMLPRNLDQLILLINQLRRNDRVYVVATRQDSGVLIDGSRLPNLPPSVSYLLSQPGSRGQLSVVPRRRVLEAIVPTDAAVEGAATLTVEVIEP